MRNIRHPQPYLDPLPRASGNIEWTAWIMSTKNPFHGWFAVAWGLDDWAHRRLSIPAHRRLLGWLCNHLDRELWK